MRRSLTIAGESIDDDSDCFVIAEIGCNHMGKVDIAKEMITRAKESGVNAVKMQKRDPRSLFTREMFDRQYCRI